jgi:transcriptional regulator with XRE-family HTH domain
MTTLGQRIREARQGRGLTLRAFAAKIEVAPPFVTDLEADRRRPSPENLARISDVLDVPLEELEALDPRITPEDKEWVDESPAVSQLLRKLRDVPNRDDVLEKLHKVVEGEKKKRGGGN